MPESKKNELIRQFRACLLFNAPWASDMLLQKPTLLWKVFVDELDEADLMDARTIEEGVAMAIRRGSSEFVFFISGRLAVELKGDAEKERACRASMLVALAEHFDQGTYNRKRFASEAVRIFRRLAEIRPVYQPQLKYALSLFRGSGSGPDRRKTFSPV